ncbi:hypothetical protein [Agrobacterium sp. NPDC089420]|uniref:hypothetical protein n=1 Tax=Agrobacterium sp. NPDC089420 TaxID=3363918 RepID=UPI00384EB790
MYSDRKKTARAFVKFFCFFSGPLFPLREMTGKKPGTAGFLSKAGWDRAATALRKSRRQCLRLWTSFLISLGKARKTGCLAWGWSQRLRFFPIKMKKLILLS